MRYCPKRSVSAREADRFLCQDRSFLGTFSEVPDLAALSAVDPNAVPMLAAGHCAVRGDCPAEAFGCYFCDTAPDVVLAGELAVIVFDEALYLGADAVGSVGEECR